MKNKHQFALNRLFFCFILVGIFLSVTVVPLALEEISLGILMGAMALGLLVTPLILMPYCYRFDSEGVTLRYLFVKNERYLWENVREVTVHTESKSIGLSNYFELEANPEGKRYFYMEGHIRKSGRTQRLLETYWQKKITGYFYEELKSKLKRRLEKEELATRQHLTDEIVPMERKMRAEARKVLQPLAARAEELGLCLNYEFLYLTSDLELHKRRPAAGYDYTATVELSLHEETDEARILCMDAKLLQVHLTKRGYKGSDHEYALDQMEGELKKAFEKIQSYGFEKYLTRH